MVALREHRAVPLLSGEERRGNKLNRFKDVRAENGASRDQDLALTCIFVPVLFDSGYIGRFTKISRLTINSSAPLSGTGHREPSAVEGPPDDLCHAGAPWYSPQRQCKVFRVDRLEFRVWDLGYGVHKCRVCGLTWCLLIPHPGSDYFLGESDFCGGEIARILRYLLKIYDICR